MCILQINVWMRQKNGHQYQNGCGQSQNAKIVVVVQNKTTKSGGGKMIEQKYSEMKTVTILLTRYSDLLGRFISVISKYHYSHASISIDEREDIFYSFNMKGFVVEKPKQRCPRKRAAGSICIRLQVPESTYQAIQAEINEFLRENRKH